MNNSTMLLVLSQRDHYSNAINLMLSGFGSVAMELANALINGETNTLFHYFTDITYPLRAPFQLGRDFNEFPLIPRTGPNRASN